MTSENDNDRIMLGRLAHEHLGGHAGDYAVSGPLQQRANSRLYRIDNSHLPFSLAAKFCLLPGRAQADAATAVEQFNALEQVNQRLCHPVFNVIQPVLTKPELGLLLMEWIEAPSLTSYFRCSISRQQQLNGLKSAGNWLAHFHQSGPLASGNFDWQHKQKEARQLQSQALANAIFHRAANLLVKTSTHLQTVTVQRSWLHGDFKTDNILIQPQRVVGIDIALRNLNAIEYDIAQFLNQLALLWHAPQRGWHILPAKEFSETFLKAYQSIQPQVNPFLIAWLRLFLVLSLWQLHCDASPQSIKRFVLHRLFAKVSDQCVRQLAAQSD
jgi:serine/threonine protein kinase